MKWPDVVLKFGKRDIYRKQTSIGEFSAYVTFTEKHLLLLITYSFKI
jgi:hypothetical protein